MLEFDPDQERCLRYECAIENCFYATSDKYKLDRHMAVCRSTTEIEYKQIAKGKLDMSVRRQLEQDGVIPDPTWQNWHFATWDVECFMEKRVNAMGREVSVHRLVSIGIKTSFGDTPEHYIERENMDPIEVRSMMEEFLTTLTFMHAEMLEHIPESIIKKEKNFER